MLNIVKRIALSGVALATIGATVLGTSGAASASVPVTATTSYTSHPDSGGAGNTWAMDGFTATSSYTDQGSVSPVFCAGGSPCHKYAVSVTVSDGVFSTVPNVLAPNQGFGHAGQHTSASSVDGTFTGSIQYAPVYSVNVPNPNLVPDTQTSEAFSPLPLTAFAGSFSGGAVNTFTFRYVQASGLQNWTDATSTNDGQTASAGQITGH